MEKKNAAYETLFIVDLDLGEAINGGESHDVSIGVQELVAGVFIKRKRLFDGSQIQISRAQLMCFAILLIVGSTLKDIV